MKLALHQRNRNRIFYCQRKLSVVAILLLFFMDCSVGEEDSTKVRQKNTSRGVLGVTGYAVDLPCDINAADPKDKPVLILWYRDIFGTPIYSYDMRSEVVGRHWMERKTLGNRASFYIKKMPSPTTDRSGQGSQDEILVLRAFLRIEKLEPSDAGSYRCRVDFKKAPSRNVKVRLALIEPPNQPQILTENGTPVAKDPQLSPPMTINSSLSLVCKVLGGNPLPDLIWWKEVKRDGGQMDREIIPDTKVQTQVVESRMGNSRYRQSELILKKLNRSSQGLTIGCSANNTDLVEPVFSTMTINMLLPPIRAKIVREWSYFLAGKPYNISCQVLGSHPAAYTKAKVGERELKVANFEVSAAGDISTTQVSFTPRLTDDGKLMSCRAENPHLPENHAVEDQWKIEVQYVPRTELSLAEYRATRVQVNEGELVQLKCLVRSNPPAHTIHWRRNGKTIGPLEKEFIYEAGTKLVDSEVERNMANAMLSLKSVHAGNAGNYTCIAENLLGLGESNALQLQIKYRPSCSRSGEVVVFAGLDEAVQLDCKVRAFPKQNMNFSWRFHAMADKPGNTSIGPTKKFDGPDSIPSRLVRKIENSSEDGDLMMEALHFMPSSAADYGSVTCKAQNEAGAQNNPCVFQVRPKTLPVISECITKSSGLDWVRLRCKVKADGSGNGMQIQDGQLGPDTKIQVEALSLLQRSEKKVWKSELNRTLDFDLDQTNSYSTFTFVETSLSDLSSGQDYQLLVKLQDPHRLPKISAVPFKLTTRTMTEDEKHMMVVTVEASTKGSGARKAFDAGSIPMNDPIRLLPIVGILSVIVIVLIMVAVVIIVVVRGRSYASEEAINSNLKTHIGFNRSLDFDIDPDSADARARLETDGDVMRNLESISKLDSYEQLNDVRFEGFSSLERRRSMADEAQQKSSSDSHVCEVFVHVPPKGERKEVPVGSLCEIEDPQGHLLSSQCSVQLRSSNLTSDEYGFREAIPAPTPVRRISQVLPFQANDSSGSNTSTETQISQPDRVAVGGGQRVVTFADVVTVQSSGGENEEDQCKERLL